MAVAGNDSYGYAVAKLRRWSLDRIRLPQKDAMAIVSFRHTSSALLLGALLGLLSSWPLTTTADPPAAVIAHQVMQVVEGRYVEEVDGPKWLLDGLDQALSQLDRHSRFFPPAEATRFEQETGGILFGIGIIMKKNENGGATIDKVLPDGPAQRAGILAGDQIVSIEGDRSEDWQLAQISARIRGILDTEVSLGLLRNGTELQITARRAEVQIPSITESTLFAAEDRSTTSIGLIRLQQFQPESSTQIQQAIEKMIASGIEGVILDLRNNGGGLLHEAVKIVSLFLKEGQTVVSTRGRTGSGDHQVFQNDDDGPFLELPLAILIDRYSASASEIVASSLRDHQRAVLVGEISFGKWSVQDLISVGRGKTRSLVKLTTQSFHAPQSLRVTQDENGDRAGIQPDLEIETKPQQHLQLSSHWRQRSFDRIENPTELTRLADPDDSLEVDEIGNGDPVLSAAIQLLRDAPARTTLLNNSTPVSQKTEDPAAEETPR